MHIRHRLAGAIVCALTAATGVTAAPSAAIAQSKHVTASEIAKALDGVSDLLASHAAAVSDHDSATQTSSVDIRHNGTIAFKTASASDIVITLPYANQAQGVLTNGGVAFAGKDSSGTFALPAAGGAQVLMVAANKSAPITYPFAVQNGSVIALPNGGLLLRDRTGQPNRVIPAPWARDAAKRSVSTRFVVASDGKTFSQEVSHRQPGVQYPVVADPTISYGWNIYLLYSSNEVRDLRSQGALVVYGTMLGATCGNLPHWALKIACAGAIGGMMWDIQSTFAVAANSGQCVKISVAYNGIPNGWWALPCSGGGGW